MLRRSFIMKNGIFALFLLFSLPSHSAASGTDSHKSAIVNYLHNNANSLKNVVSHFFIGGVTLWALREILTDMGYRYLTCKEIARKYAQELRQEGTEVLTEREISFWAFVQGLSEVPRVWWREITATALLCAFIYQARKLLLVPENGDQEIKVAL